MILFLTNAVFCPIYCAGGTSNRIKNKTIKDMKPKDIKALKTKDKKKIKDKKTKHLYPY